MLPSTALAVVLCAGLALATPRISRIVGGESTTIEQYPELVQIDYMSIYSGTWSQSCAGIILTSRWLLSSAYCFSGILYQPQFRRVRAGATFRNTGGVISNVLRAVNHPDYGQNGMDGDISVVQLETALQWTSAVQPGSFIAQGAAIPDHLPVFHAGWGRLAQDGEPSVDLQHVMVYTVNHNLCRDRYASLYPNTPVTTNMICAGILGVGGKDACQEDSGGPLFYDRVTIGVISWGEGCANDTYPGISTNVASYTSWILETLTLN